MTDKRRCISCGEAWATTTADDVCDRCREVAPAVESEARRLLRELVWCAWMHPSQHAKSERFLKALADAKAYLGDDA
jgi:hypothetical protein